MNRRLMIVALMVMLMPFDSGRVDTPRLVTSQRLPVDVQQLTDLTWVAFQSAFPGKRMCIGTVELMLVDDVEGGAAEYRPADRLIRIEIPTTPVRFPESLAHELGHHLEEVCAVEEELGAPFRAAIGVDGSVDWRRADRWQERPTEHFAEAVVQLVIGDRYTHADLIELTPAALAIVESWSVQAPGEAGA